MWRQKGSLAVLNFGHFSLMKEQLTTIIYLLPKVQLHYFIVDLMLDGYSPFLKFQEKEIATMLGGSKLRAISDEIKGNEINESWYKVTVSAFSFLCFKDIHS